MRHVDFSPLYRSTVGFDRLFTMLDSLAQPDGGQTYPPYNIERTGEDAYRIRMAVAGFSEEDISIEAHRNVLTVKGERKEETERGRCRAALSRHCRPLFERRFQLADHVDVTGAQLKNGLLHIDLKRNIPEEMKPRKVEISKAPATTPSRSRRRSRRKSGRDLIRSGAAPAGAAFLLSSPHLKRAANPSISAAVVAKLVTSRHSVSSGPISPADACGIAQG